MPYLIPVEFLAVVVSAIFGVLLAARKGMDIAGVFSIALAVAFGGGTLRDLFLDRHPLFWIGNPHYPIVVFVIVLLSGVILRFVKKIQPLLLFPDSLGMALFTILGTGYALDSGTTYFVAVLLGVITGTFGGVIGDVLCNDIPSLFVPSPLNATCAFAGACVYVGLVHFGLSTEYSTWIGILVIVAFRIIAVRRNWCFPAVRPASLKK